MKIERNILIAFLLNLGFSVLEFFGGLFTGSVAILSDAVHDLGDAVGIGVSWFMERKSLRPPDERYTYGYARFSVLGSLFTCGILLLGSGGVVISAAGRLMNPIPIRTDGMLLLAVVGIAVNLTAALVTRKGDSLNQKAVSLHMLEDVLTWLVVLVGAAIMRVTEWTALDPLLSVAVAVYIAIHAASHLRVVLGIFLDKVPDSLSVAEIRDRLTTIDGVLAVRRLRVRSIDGIRHAAEVCLDIHGDPASVKQAVREMLAAWGVTDVIIEIE